MRAKPICNLNIVIMADKAIMPTDARTEERLHFSVEPVEVFDYRNRVEFIAACKRSINRGIPIIEMPSGNDVINDEHGMLLKNPIELKYSNFKSMDELERNSLFVAVECYDQGFLIQSWGRAKSGKWSDEKVLELRLTPDVGIEGAVDAILEHLETRQDRNGVLLNDSK